MELCEFSQNCTWSHFKR